MYYGHMGYFGFFGGIGMLLVWGAFIWLIVWLVNQNSKEKKHKEIVSSREILDRRLAKGEISHKEYDKLKMKIKN